MPIHHNILAKPDDCAGRDGDRNCPAEDENGSIQHAADNHIPDFRATIRRQLQHKGGRHTAQEGFAQQERNQKRDADGKHNQQEHKAACQKQIAPCKKETRKENQRRETPIAGDEAIRKDGNEPLSGGFDDAAGGYPCGIAAKAHAHVERNLGYFPFLSYTANKSIVYPYFLFFHFCSIFFFLISTLLYLYTVDQPYKHLLC